MKLRAKIYIPELREFAAEGPDTFVSERFSEFCTQVKATVLWRIERHRKKETALFQLRFHEAKLLDQLKRVRLEMEKP